MTDEVRTATGTLSSESDGSKTEPGPDEKLMPTAHKERTFVCETCSRKTVVKSFAAVCIGVDLGVLVRLPAGTEPEYAIYRNGLDAEGNIVVIPGEVVKIGSDEEVYSYDGKKVLVDGAWGDNTENMGTVPGEHGAFDMKEDR